MITEKDLLLEIGSEAYNDLTAEERELIIRTYETSQIKQAGMKAFDLLRKKFKCTYRMGRMYEALSEKYRAYESIWKSYLKQVRAGKTAKDTGKEYNVERYKFLEKTHSTQDQIDAAD